MNQRSKSIDIAKRITILWVVWMHMKMPSILYASVQMPFFFFISGALWNNTNNFLSFIQKKSKSLLIPTISFVILAYVLFSIKHEKFFTESSLLWKIDYSIKGSITWFLIVLFIFNIIEYYVEKFNLIKLEVIISVLLYPLGAYLYAKNYFSIIPIIPLAHILVFWIYYTLGAYMGKKLIYQINIDNKRSKYFSIISCFVILLVHIIPWNNKILSHISFYLYIFPYTLSYIYLLLYLCNKYKNVRLSKSLSYIGCNSIIIYLIHWPLWNYILHDFSNKINCYFLYIIMIFLLILSIIIVNKYIPFIVGKSTNKQSKI